MSKAVEQRLEEIENTLKAILSIMEEASQNTDGPTPLDEIQEQLVVIRTQQEQDSGLIRTIGKYLRVYLEKQGIWQTSKGSQGKGSQKA